MCGAQYVIGACFNLFFSTKEPETATETNPDHHPQRSPAACTVLFVVAVVESGGVSRTRPRGGAVQANTRENVERRKDAHLSFDNSMSAVI